MRASSDKTRKERQDFLVPVALHPYIWPDSGLTRNTRAHGYRCSVPGLAGFTGATLCGARSLITCQKIADWQLPNADLLCGI